MSSPKAVVLARVVHRLLTNPDGIAVAEVAGWVDRTPKTMGNYLKTLQTAVPELLHGGVSLVQEVDGEDGRRWVLLRETVVEADDALMVQMAALELIEQSFGHLNTTGFGQEIRRLKQHVSAHTANHKHAKRLLKHLERKIVVIPHGPKNYEGKDGILMSVLRAVILGRKLEFNYRSDTRTDRRTISPYTLIAWRSALYVRGSTNTAHSNRTFALDRMSDLRELVEGFQYPGTAKYDPRQEFDGAFGLITRPTDPMQEVELKVCKDTWAAREICERMWHRSLQHHDAGDGTLRVRLRVRVFEELRSWVRSFGTHVTVVKPANLLDDEEPLPG